MAASVSEGSPAPGPDGRLRCPWALTTRDYVDYHDQDWGRACRGDAALYERLTLEAFQSGLSWLTILRKRAAFREAFAGFDPALVAAFGAADVARLLADAAIVRNRAKIDAAVANAAATVALGEGGLDRLIWSHAPAPRPRPVSTADVPATTQESAGLAAALRQAGFRFVGPTTTYALMQACGLVDDHLADCETGGSTTPRARLDG